MVKDELYPMLRPEWVLRNDETKVICYLLSTEESSHLVLNPEVGFMASFLDGRQTVAEIADDLCYVGQIDSKAESRKLVSAVIDALNEGVERVALLESPAIDGPRYDPLDFIISPQHFEGNVRLRRPLTLLIYFCAWCSTRCVYCYADLENMRRCQHLPVAEWVRIAREAHELGVRIIQFTGGDTLGREDAIDFLCELIKLDFLFLVSTKCHVGPNDAQRLMDAGWNVPVNNVQREFQVSIDSCERETLKLLMGRDGYLEQATATVSNLLRAGISPRVKATLTSYNWRDVRGLVERFREMGVRCFRATLYSHSFYRHDDRLFMSEDMKKETAETLHALLSEYPELTIEGDAMQPLSADADNETEAGRKQAWNSRSNCSAGRTNIGVAPDGQAVLCEQMPLEPPYFVGDLTKQSILEVWNSTKLLDFVLPNRDLFSGTPCETCSEFEECVHHKGYCFRDSWFVYGKLHHPPPKCPWAPFMPFRFI